MKYERLTIVAPNGECRVAETKFNSDKSKQKAVNRLAELEDKIEAGTLIELPCRVGDTVYIITKQGLDIYAVEKVIVCDLWYSETDNCLYPMTADECPLSEIFITKAEAETKLKELRGA